MTPLGVSACLISSNCLSNSADAAAKKRSCYKLADIELCLASYLEETLGEELEEDRVSSDGFYEAPAALDFSQISITLEGRIPRRPCKVFLCIGSDQAEIVCRCDLSKLHGHYYLKEHVALPSMIRVRNQKYVDEGKTRISSVFRIWPHPNANPNSNPNP